MLKVMAVYDVKAKMFQQPMFFLSVGMAVRGFADAVNGDKKESPFAAHPEDYTLHHIADYDEETAKFVEPGAAFGEPEGSKVICTALSLVREVR